MSAIIGLAARGASAFGPTLGRLFKEGIKYAPQIVDFGVQSAPLIGQGLDMLTTKFSKGKKNFGFADMGSELKGAFDKRNQSVVPSSNKNYGRSGRQNLPIFEDEATDNERYLGSNTRATISRRQFGRGSDTFFGGRGDLYNSRDDEEEFDDEYDNNYGRTLNQGFRRQYNVYSERGFGQGYGRNSSIINNNEMTRTSSYDGYSSRKRPSRFEELDDEDEEEMFAPPQKTRAFNRRRPENTSSRYGSSRVNNLNYEDMDWADLI